MPPPPAGPPIEVLLAHREWMARTARALVHGDAEAGDVEQEAWLKILERPPVVPLRSPRAWLASVLRSVAIDRARSLGRRRRHEEMASRPEALGDAAGEIVARAETAERLARVVLDLEEPFRTTVLLRYYEGLAPREIADRTGVPAETVRTRLHRALARLREALDTEHRGDRRAWCLALLPVLRLPASGSASTGSAGGAGFVVGGMLMTQKAVAAAAVALVAGGGILGWAVGRAGAGDTSGLAGDLDSLRASAEEQAARLARLEKAGGSAGELAALRAAAADRAARLEALEKDAAKPRGGDGPSATAGKESERMARLATAVGALEKRLAATGGPALDPARRTKEVLEGLKAITDPKRQIALKDAVEDLVRLGDAAVPGVVEVLDSGSDRQYFGKPVMVAGGIPGDINYSGMRQVLFDALRQMATPLSKQRLFEAAGRTKSTADLRDLLVPYYKSADPVVIEGIAALTPDMLRRVGESEAGDEVAWDLGRWLTRWMQDNGIGANAAAIEDAVAKARFGKEGWSRWAPDFFRLLVEFDTERAVKVALALREAHPDLLPWQQAMVAFTQGPRNFVAPLTRWAEYFASIFTKANLDDEQRKALYGCMPRFPCPAIQDPVKRAEDATVFLTFLEGRLQVEIDAALKSTIEFHVKTLRDAIAREGR